MQQLFTHRDGRSATAATPTEAVTLKAMGFHPATQDAESPVDPQPGDDLDSRTVEDLKGYAAEYGIDLAGASKKAEIVETIRAAFADND
ncbi:MAG TPA: hypothetical protein VFL73_02795 [Solirubrobacteraceae bacterium]|nr:hypothetical protein [Solirubrobacteraceae bacterium]